MKRLTFTKHTVQCPLENCTASLKVRSDLDGCPSRRHLDVAACSLMPSAIGAVRPRATESLFLGHRATGFLSV